MPDIAVNPAMPAEEAGHALRVLRMKTGDELWAMDGAGSFYKCRIAEASKRDCMVEVLERVAPGKTWQGRLTLAVAPTKMNERIEWMVEKAVEIGVDRIVLLDCHNGERSRVNLERLQRIVVSAMKQSRKPWITGIVPMTTVAQLAKESEGQLFIAHCRDDAGVPRRALFDCINRDGTDATVMIGPEGDFSREEVELAMQAGAVPVSLGKSRLRTETAALVAVHTMMMAKETII